MSDVERFQWNKGSGWTAGQPTFDPIFDNMADLLRFHMGDQFVIEELGQDGPPRSLKEVKHYLPTRVENAPLDRVFTVRSLKDGYALKCRRHRIVIDTGHLVLQHAMDLLGVGYVYGDTDCSWLTKTCLAKEGIVLPHNSRAQFADPQVIQIPQSQAKPADLILIHNGDHVAFYRGPTTVIDTEPHDAPAPWGGWQGTGVRIRSSDAGYYCGRENWDAVGRIVAINGAVA